jgi:hypothetical protein
MMSTMAVMSASFDELVCGASFYRTARAWKRPGDGKNFIR